MRIGLLIATLASCGDARAALDAAPPIEDGGFVSAAHSPLPQIPDHGGPVLHHVELVTITFASYAYESSIHAFGDWIVTSNWLAGLCDEYRCGEGSHVQKVVIAEQPPAVVTTPDIEGFLHAAMLDGRVPRPPTHDNDWMYVVYYPITTRVDAPGFVGCQTGGYHWYVDDGQARWAYAPIPDCSATRPAGWTPLGSIEENASHELIEAITDPYPTAPGFRITDPTNPWSTLYGEIGDLCVTAIAQDGDFTTTRAWSNAAAAAGRDPCQPISDHVYFNVGAPASVTVAPGGTATFDAIAWSTGPRPPWHVFPYHGPQGSFDPAPRASATTVNNGDAITITVTAPSSVPTGATGSVVMYSYDDAGGPYTMWPILVHVQ
jgi:hypothetical protein